MSSFDKYTAKETFSLRYPKTFLTSYQPSSDAARRAYEKTRAGMLKLGQAIDQSPLIWSGDSALNFWALFPFGWGVAVPIVAEARVKIYTSAIPAVTSVRLGETPASVALADFWAERGDPTRADEQAALEAEARAVLRSAAVPQPIAELVGKAKELGEPDITVTKAREDFARTLGLGQLEAAALAREEPEPPTPPAPLRFVARPGLPIPVRRPVIVPAALYRHARQAQQQRSSAALPLALGGAALVWWHFLR